jgi:hypothetical protein
MAAFREWVPIGACVRPRSSTDGDPCSTSSKPYQASISGETRQTVFYLLLVLPGPGTRDAGTGRGRALILATKPLRISLRLA